jgi:hypothetical protein
MYCKLIQIYYYFSSIILYHTQYLNMKLSIKLISNLIILNISLLILNYFIGHQVFHDIYLQNYKVVLDLINN